MYLKFSFGEVCISSVMVGNFVLLLHVRGWKFCFMATC